MLTDNQISALMPGYAKFALIRDRAYYQGSEYRTLADSYEHDAAMYSPRAVIEFARRIEQAVLSECVAEMDAKDAEIARLHEWKDENGTL